MICFFGRSVLIGTYSDLVCHANNGTNALSALAIQSSNPSLQQVLPFAHIGMGEINVAVLSPEKDANRTTHERQSFFLVEFLFLSIPTDGPFA
jgi:hypothetical protein